MKKSGEKATFGILKYSPAFFIYIAMLFFLSCQTENPALPEAKAGPPPALPVKTQEKAPAPRQDRKPIPEFFSSISPDEPSTEMEEAAVLENDITNQANGLSTDGPAPSLASEGQSVGTPAGEDANTINPPEIVAAGPGHAPELPPVEPELIFHGDRSKPMVAITFDACENEKPARFDRKIWDILVEKKVKATIFLGGKWMESHPEITKMIGQNELIEIGNHSYIHPDFRQLSPKKITEEITKTQDIQYRLMGKCGTVFRFPYGTYNKRSLEAVAENGLYPIQWEVESGDPSRKVKAKAITKTVLEQTQNGSIIIFHINGRGWNTAEALPGIVDELRKRGFELVTVSELMGFENRSGLILAK